MLEKSATLSYPDRERESQQKNGVEEQRSASKDGARFAKKMAGNNMKILAKFVATPLGTR